MKLIGVTGKSGAGKTTFSNLFADKDKAGVIHVDDLVGEIKKKYFKMFLQPKENNTTENTRKNPKLQVGAKKFFYRNKILFRFLMFVRSKMIEKELNRQIEALKLQGKEIIVIDDWVLFSHKNLMPKMSKIYFVERRFQTRRQGIKDRDNSTSEEMKVNDLPYALKICDTIENAQIVSNNGTLNDLQRIVDEEYEKIGIKSFDERYCIRARRKIPEIITEKLDKSKTIYKGENREKQE